MLGFAAMDFNIRRFFVLLCVALVGFWVVADVDPNGGWGYFVSFAFLASVLFICFESSESVD